MTAVYENCAGREGPEFERLIDKLKNLVDGCQRGNRAKRGPCDEAYLRGGIGHALQTYLFMKDLVGVADTLHEYAGDARRLRTGLELPWNTEAAVRALLSDDNPVWLFRLNDADAKADIETTKRVLDKLASIQAKPQRRGRPSNFLLRSLVTDLASHCERLTGTEFTQYWTTTGTPGTGAAQFVHAVVAFADSEALTALPKACAVVVREMRTERRQSKSKDCSSGR